MRSGARFFAVLAIVSLLGMTTPSVVRGEVRVMSFNLRYGTANDGENAWELRKEWVLKTIEAFGPDLLGTQETLGFQRDFLAARMPGYVAVGVGRNDGKEDGEMTALFFRDDRFELLGQGHFWLSETPEVPGSLSWDSSLTRMCSWVRLRDRREPNAPPIFFINTHFDHRGAEARRESAKLCRRMIETLAGSDADVVFTGDFNAAVDSDPYRAIFTDPPEATRLVDTYQVAGTPTEAGEATFNGFQLTPTGRDRIDWIGVSRRWKVLQAAIDRTSFDGRVPSDHYPVVAVVDR